jgi:hypothetical protein
MLFMSFQLTKFFLAEVLILRHRSTDMRSAMIIVLIIRSFQVIVLYRNGRMSSMLYSFSNVPGLFSGRSVRKCSTGNLCYTGY